MPVIKLYLAGKIESIGEMITIAKQAIPKRKNKDNRQKRKCDIFNVFANGRDCPYLIKTDNGYSGTSKE